MRFGVLLSEAWRNVATGTSRAAGLACVFAVVMLVCGGSDALAVRHLVEEGRAYRAAAASVKVIAAAGAIDAERCEAIGDTPGIAGAGSLRKAAEPLRPSALPGSSLPVYEVSPSFGRLLGVRAPPAGILLAAGVADRLGVAPGDRVPVRGGSVLVGAVFEWPEDGRSAGLGYAALVPVTASGWFDECWCETWPESDLVPVLLRMAVRQERVDPATSPELGSANPALGSMFRGGPQFSGRITQLAPLLAAAAAALIVAIAARLRRLELASAQHYGVGRADLIAITLVETGVALAAPVAVAVAATGLVAALGVEAADAVGVFAAGVRVVASTVAGALVASAAATWSIRPRSFMRYIQERD